MEDLNESEKEDLNTLLKLDEASSAEVWDALSGASDELLVTYLVNRIGIKKIKEILSNKN